MGAQEQVDRAGQNADPDIALKTEAGRDADGKGRGELEFASRKDPG